MPHAWPLQCIAPCNSKHDHLMLRCLLNPRSSRLQATQTRGENSSGAQPSNAERENAERKPEDSANGIPTLRETDPRESLFELQDEQVGGQLGRREGAEDGPGELNGKLMGFTLSVVYSERARISAIDLLESVVLAMYTGCTCNRPFSRSPFLHLLLLLILVLLTLRFARLSASLLCVFLARIRRISRCV